MKNLLVVLNAILIALVIFLFVIVHNMKKSMSWSQKDNQISKKDVTAVYVNEDSLTQNLDYLVDLKKEIEIRQTAIQKEYDEKGRDLQDEYAAYQQKVQSRNISEVDAQKEQQKMQEKKSVLDELQKQLEDLGKETQARNKIIVNKIQKFVTEYNKSRHFDYIFTYSNQGGQILVANDSLDITNNVVAALNKEYNDSVKMAKQH
jgi:outer membrane protein